MAELWKAFKSGAQKRVGVVKRGTIHESERSFARRSGGGRVLLGCPRGIERVDILIGYLMKVQ